MAFKKPTGLNLLRRFRIVNKKRKHYGRIVEYCGLSQDSKGKMYPTFRLLCETFGWIDSYWGDLDYAKKENSVEIKEVKRKLLLEESQFTVITNKYNSKFDDVRIGDVLRLELDDHTAYPYFFNPRTRNVIYFPLAELQMIIN